jgi:CDP-diacylglycerol--glycerol-3-phosphate 3-phosphatidyltransferase
MARKRLRDEMLNLPNSITLVRIVVIPLFVWLTWRADPLSSFLAAVVFAFAAVSDLVDGWLARRMNQVSLIGKFLDPLADKLIVTAGLVLLAQMGRVEAWLVIVLLCRELTVTGLRQIAVGEGLVIAAGQGGKWKTSLQLAGIVGVLVHFRYTVDLLVVRDYVFDFQLIGEWLLALSLVPSLVSAWQYFRDFLAQVEAKDEEAARAARESPAPTAGPTAG